MHKNTKDLSISNTQWHIKKVSLFGQVGHISKSCDYVDVSTSHFVSYLTSKQVKQSISASMTIWQTQATGTNTSNTEGMGMKSSHTFYAYCHDTPNLIWLLTDNGLDAELKISWICKHHITITQILFGLGFCNSIRYSFQLQPQHKILFK